MIENTDNLVLTPLSDGRRWRVRKMFAYWITPPDEDATSFRVTVFTGFITDFASIPRILWIIFPPWGKYGPAAIIHDYIYAYHKEPGSTCCGFDRSMADKIFLWVMQDYAVNPIIRYILYLGVCLFSYTAWVNGPKRRRQKVRWE